MDTRSYMPRSGHDDAISPLTDSSGLSMSVSTTAVSTPTDTSSSRPETPVYEPGERKIDYECFPEVVPSNDPEPAVLENAVTGFNLPEVACTYTHEVSKEVVPTYAGLEVSTPLEPPTGAVTPLHLLGDQPNWIDCPFCETRARTTIKKRPSNLTQFNMKKLDARGSVA
ncbi:uncharacterized protein NECHADRAFT_84323 [Fusarium vanettenii 77-13-4]|uniref:LITAF domain-containing protein n=1 Tax=Fusarium vanettenii (strain ATCC MYA-4622 / CBS 123669 / FGSC 9596 / NRRL 45880 / 77-13-4) TaxID=660122 RepID=C7ZCS5_FUSV7|nr:uncharacterized protein NECHADRAFT_84323 [Fusarium vanettenii 77-13-4]EEU38094.1 hypothetical protein NECHADRAFT_84323 [Fusarium vanettenii 77-13-4]